MHTWQPIETAPKNGTSILIYESGLIDVVKWSDIHRSFIRWDHEERKSSNYEPSFWMQLPDFPAIPAPN